MLEPPPHSLMLLLSLWVCYVNKFICIIIFSLFWRGDLAKPPYSKMGLGWPTGEGSFRRVRWGKGWRIGAATKGVKVEVKDAQESMWPCLQVRGGGICWGWQGWVRVPGVKRSVAATTEEKRERYRNDLKDRCADMSFQMRQNFRQHLFEGRWFSLAALGQE